MAGDALRQGQPVVSGLRPHRARGRRKVRIGEGADGDADDVGQAFVLPENCRAAIRAEPESEPGAAVALPAKSVALAFGGDDLVAREEGARSKNRPGAPLAGQAMTRRHDARLADRADAQLAAGAGGFALDACSHVDTYATDWSHRRDGRMLKIGALLAEAGRLAKRSKLRIGPLIAVGILTLVLCLGV